MLVLVTFTSTGNSYKYITSALFAHTGLTLLFYNHSFDGQKITPTKGFLANAESSMFLLSPDAGRRDKLYQMDLERGAIVSQWACQKDGADIPMSDVVADTKSSQMEVRVGAFPNPDTGYGPCVTIYCALLVLFTSTGNSSNTS